MEEELKRLRELVEDNNAILHRLQRAARWGKFFRAIYWVLILASFVASYYLLQPFVDQALKTYKQLGGNLQQLNALKNLPSQLDQNSVNQLLKQLQGQMPKQ